MNKIRLGMIGGGPGAFIGPIHRIAARLDDRFELVCGVFSSRAECSVETGAALGLEADRVYTDVTAMLAGEVLCPYGQRMDAVAIVTPNHLHAEQAAAALRAGFHVIIDKPITVSLQELRSLETARRETGKIVQVTLTYLGYPMVQQARALIADGALGELRKVYVSYLQGWLSKRLEAEGQKQATWRTSVDTSGPAGALGDIGTHAQALCEYVCDSRIARVFADTAGVVPGRLLDDDADILFRLGNGTRGLLTASQICAGEANNLSIRVFGSEAGLFWHQESPTLLTALHSDGRQTRYRAGTDAPSVSGDSLSLSRTPAGHPEGYLEAFSNLYAGFADAIEGRDSPCAPDFMRPLAYGSIAFVDAAIRSARTGCWIDVPSPINPEEL